MIEVLLGISFIVSIGGNGHLILRRGHVSFDNKVEEWGFSCSLGLGVLALIVLLLGISHLLYREVLIPLLVVWFLLGAKESLHQTSRLKQKIYARISNVRIYDFFFLSAALAVCGFGFTLIRALAPPHGATDPLAYQLALPKIYLYNHYLSFEPTITGALYPTFLGLTYLVGLAIEGGVLAQLIHFTTSALCSVAICGLCIRYFSLRVGVLSAVIFSFVPIIVIFGAQGYVDIGLCLFQFMAFSALANWIDSRNTKMLLLGAVMAGFSLGTKHQGIPTAFVGCAAIVAVGIYRKEMVRCVFRNLAFFLVPILAIVGPWYLRALSAAGNPIWPLANDFWGGSVAFGNPPQIGIYNASDSVSSFIERLFPSANWFANYWHSLSPWSWTFAPGGSQKAIGVYFVALIPGVVLLRRTTAFNWLLGFCFVYYLILIRFLHMNPRYGLVLLAFSSILTGLVADKLASSKTLVIGNVFKVAFVSTIILNLTWGAHLARPMWDVALNRQTKEEFLERNEANYRLFEFINNNIDDAAVVLLQGIVKGFYCEREYLWDHPHQSVVKYEQAATPDELYDLLVSLKVTHIARMISIPAGRIALGYPQYFLDEYHEDFRRKYLKLLYRDDQFALFSINK
jgi:4-amino-4-deoxy-L-arabinose transferase-like glycosyltransferase